MNITFLFYDGMTPLDVIGPQEVLGRLPNVTVQRVAKNAGLVEAGLGLQLMAEYSLADIQQTDVLVVGGSGNATNLRHEPQILKWIKKIHEQSLWTTSVCTGSLILGAAGILQGIQATSHWAVLGRLSNWGAKPMSRRIIEDGKIMTAAGVSAGLDMALLLASKLAGQAAAETIQLTIEYDPEPPFNSGSPSKAKPEIYQALQAQLLQRFEKG